MKRLSFFRRAIIVILALCLLLFIKLIFNQSDEGERNFIDFKENSEVIGLYDSIIPYHSIDNNNNLYISYINNTNYTVYAALIDLTLSNDQVYSYNIVGQTDSDSTSRREYIDYNFNLKDIRSISIRGLLFRDQDLLRTGYFIDNGNNILTLNFPVDRQFQIVERSFTYSMPQIKIINSDETTLIASLYNFNEFNMNYEFKYKIENKKGLFSLLFKEVNPKVTVEEVVKPYTLTDSVESIKPYSIYVFDNDHQEQFLYFFEFNMGVKLNSSDREILNLKR